MLPKDLSQGFKEEFGGGESEGQGSSLIVTEGRRELASLHIRGPVPGENISINIPVALFEVIILTRGD